MLCTSQSHPLGKCHACLLHLVPIHKTLSLDVKNALRLDLLCQISCIGVLQLGSSVDFWHKIEFQSLLLSQSLLVNVKIEADVATCYLLLSDAHRLLQTDFFLLSSHFISFHFRWLDLLGIIGGYWQLSTKRRKRVQNGPFLGNDERLFWQRAEDRNRATASLYDQLGLACYEAMEAFVEYKPL